MTRNLLQALFTYETGKLYWRDPRSNNKVKASDRAGVETSRGYRTIRVFGKDYKEHRLIYIYHNDICPEYLDHINGDRVDNRIENLRPATKSENSCNAKKSSANTSGVKGVTWHNREQRWRVTITKDRKAKTLGSFKDLEDAKQFAEVKRRELHGEYSNAGNLG